MRCQRLKKLFLSIVSVNFLLALVASTLPFEARGMDDPQENKLEEIVPQIVNGAPIGRETWPQVVFLNIQFANLATRCVCTGTLLAQETIGTARIFGFARQDVILTAAHCVTQTCSTPSVPGVVTSISYVRDGSDSPRPAQGWSPNVPAYQGGVNGNDTALVFFNEQNDFTNGLPICEQEPTVGTQVTLVGFGCNNYTDLNPRACSGVGIKRRGANTIQIVNQTTGTIEFTGPVRDTDGSTQNTAPGDSGSPYIVTQNGRSCIAAVLSGANVFTDNNGNGLPDFGDTKNSVGANLHNTSSRTFLTTQLPGIDCDIYETQQNCTTRFTELHQFLYRRQPTTATLQTNVARLNGDLTTLWRITTAFRFSLLQAAGSMFLEQP